jgi:hypothetical protein
MTTADRTLPPIPRYTGRDADAEARTGMMRHFPAVRKKNDLDWPCSPPDVASSGELSHAGKQ